MCIDFVRAGLCNAHLIGDYRKVILNHGIVCSVVVEIEADAHDYFVSFVKVVPLVEHLLVADVTLGKDFIVFVSELETVVKPNDA